MEMPHVLIRTGTVMPALLTILDRALILAQHELDALRAGDVETAELHFDERSILLDQAIETMDEQDPDDYRVKLIALQGYNQLIQEEGQELLEKIRLQLASARKTSRRARGYAKVSMMQ